MADAVKVHHDCSERVYKGGSFRALGCSKPGTVERDVTRTVYHDRAVKVYNEETFAFEDREAPGPRTSTVTDRKWFCGTHDPEAKAERENKRRAEREAEWGRKERARNRDRRVSEATVAVVAAAKKLVAKSGGDSANQSEEFNALEGAVAALGEAWT